MASAQKIPFTSQYPVQPDRLKMETGVALPPVGVLSISAQLKGMVVGASCFTTKESHVNIAYGLNHCSCKSKGPKWAVRVWTQGNLKGWRIWRIK